MTSRRIGQGQVSEFLAMRALLAVLFSLFVSKLCVAFQGNTRIVSRLANLRALKRSFAPEAIEAGPVPGEDVPEEILNMEPIYDMILVERISRPQQTGGGLFLPTTEGDDEKRLGVVLRVPSEGYGLESEGGRIQGFDEIAPVKPGDRVYLKDPWGIGPKNIEIGSRCFSFHKANHVLAIAE